MLPEFLRPLFWDVNRDTFRPQDYPEYTIARILELGDKPAIAWMNQTFARDKVVEVLRSDARLSLRSANFWALMYDVPRDEVAALAPRGSGGGNTERPE